MQVNKMHANIKQSNRMRASKLNAQTEWEQAQIMQAKHNAGTQSTKQKQPNNV